jgi:hypothetical protein
MPGTSRADGYTLPSSLRTSGPTAPMSSVAAPVSTMRSIAPGWNTTSGFVIITHSISDGRPRTTSLIAPP